LGYLLASFSVGGRLFDVMQTYSSAIVLSTVICAGGAAVYAFSMQRSSEFL